MGERLSNITSSNWKNTKELSLSWFYIYIYTHTHTHTYMCVYMNINNEICSHTYELHVEKEKDKG